MVDLLEPGGGIHGVADELVDDTVVLHDYVDKDRMIILEVSDSLTWVHSLAQCGVAAYSCEENYDILRFSLTGGLLL